MENYFFKNNCNKISVGIENMLYSKKSASNETLIEKLTGHSAVTNFLTY